MRQALKGVSNLGTYLGEEYPPPGEGTRALVSRRPWGGSVLSVKGTGMGRRGRVVGGGSDT